MTETKTGVLAPFLPVARSFLSKIAQSRQCRSAHESSAQALMQAVSRRRNRQLNRSAAGRGHNCSISSTAYCGVQTSSQSLQYRVRPAYASVEQLMRFCDTNLGSGIPLNKLMLPRPNMHDIDAFSELTSSAAISAAQSSPIGHRCMGASSELCEHVVDRNFLALNPWATLGSWQECAAEHDCAEAIYAPPCADSRKLFACPASAAVQWLPWR